MEENKPNLDEALDALANPTVEEPVPTPDPPKTDPIEVVPEPEPATEPEPEPEPESSVINTLRKQYRESSTKVKQYEEMIKKVADQQGVDPDALMEKLQNEADEKNAKDKGISLDIQKQLREQSEQVKTLQEERNREVFDRKFDLLVADHPMDTTQAQEFIEKAFQAGFDLNQRDLDFRDVYFALYRKNVLQAIKTKTEQDVLARIEEQKKRSPETMRKQSQGDDGKKGSLDDALSDILI